MVCRRAGDPCTFPVDQKNVCRIKIGHPQRLVSVLRVLTFCFALQADREREMDFEDDLMGDFSTHRP